MKLQNKFQFATSMRRFRADETFYVSQWRQKRVSSRISGIRPNLSPLPTQFSKIEGGGGGSGRGGLLRLGARMGRHWRKGRRGRTVSERVSESSGYVTNFYPSHTNSSLVGTFKNSKEAETVAKIIATITNESKSKKFYFNDKFKNDIFNI